MAFKKLWKKILLPLILALLQIMCINVIEGAKVSEMGQAFLREPSDQIAIVGEHVTLPCRVVNKRGVLQWTRDDFGLGTDRNLTGFKRYRMSGSDEEGDYTLDINPVDLEDDARFQCQIGAADGIAPIRSRYATLSVLVPPEAPKLLPAGELHKTVEGRQVELRCESRGGKPASEITWIDDRGLVLTEGVRTVQELMDDGKRFVTVSILKFVASIEHHGRNFTCQAQNSANRHPQSASIRLQVHYPPHVTLKSNKGDLLEEGERVRFSCSASANPSQLSYAWYLGGKRLADGPDASTELVLDHVERKLHNLLVKCEVTNPIGRSEQSAVLNIAYAPMFTTRPVNAAGMPGDKITLTCEVDANPRPSYKWYKLDPKGVSGGSSSDGAPLLVGTASNLTIEVSDDTAGDYECVASAKGGHYAAVRSKAVIFVKSKPRIKKFHHNRKPLNIQRAVLGSTGTVECTATTVPSVQSVQWYFANDHEGQPIVTSDLGGGGHAAVGGGQNSGKYSVQENRSLDSVQSNLIIQNVQESDFRAYTCKVTNALGSDTATFTLEEQATVSLQSVLFGIIGGLIATIVIILFVVIIRRSKTSGGTNGCTGSGGKNGSDIVVISKDQLNKGSDGVSNNSSEMKVEVRTSSSLSNGDVDCWEGSEDSGPRRQIILPKSVDLTDGVGGVALHNIHAATLPPYNKADAPPPKFGTGGGNYGYYHSNISTGNYGNYNPAYTSSPSQVNSSTGSSSVVNNIASTTTLPNRQHNIGDSLTIPGGGANNKHVTYDNFNPNLEVAPSLNIDRVQQQQNQQHLATNRYSLHVRASPISPTYSQFSSGVSVKNAYPTPANAMNAGPGIMPGHLHSGGNGYGGGGLKNASFDYVPSDQLRNYRYSVPDNYAVYVNSTTSPLPTVVPIHEQTEVKSGSSLATHV